MSTNAKPENPEPVAEQPEEALSVIACDPTFSCLEFDRDHGTEVEAARRLLAEHWNLTVRAA